MHELLLYGQLAPSQHYLTLQVLAGLSATQPTAVQTHHLVYKPTRTPASVAASVASAPASKPLPGSSAIARTAAAGGDGTGALMSFGVPTSDLFYIQLTEHQHLSTNEDVASTNGAIPSSFGASFSSSNPPPDSTSQVPPSLAFSPPSWPTTLEFRDLPTPPTRRAITSRLMSSTPVTRGDARAFVCAFGYDPAGEYWIRGAQAVWGNVVIGIWRIWIVDDSKSGDSTQDTSASESLKPNGSLDIRSTSTPAFLDAADLTDERIDSSRLPALPSGAKLLDASGAWVVQAALRVQTGVGVEGVETAAAEMASVRERLRGVVELEAGERLALDPRVR